MPQSLLRDRSGLSYKWNNVKPITKMPGLGSIGHWRGERRWAVKSHCAPHFRVGSIILPLSVMPLGDKSALLSGV